MNKFSQEIDQMFEEEDNSLYYELKEQSWTINDLETAVWADSKIHDNYLKIEEIEDAAKKQIESLQEKINKVKEWAEQRKNDPLNNIEFFKQHIFLFHKKLMEQQNNENKKVQNTIKFPFYSSSFRKQQPLISFNGKEITDMKSDAEFVKIAEKVDPVLIKKEVKWGDLKKRLQLVEFEKEKKYIDKETGELIKEIDIKELPNAFSLTEPKKKKEEEV